MKKHIIETDKEWVVIQCITTVVPRGLYLSKSENK